MTDLKDFCLLLYTRFFQELFFGLEVEDLHLVILLELISKLDALLSCLLVSLVQFQLHTPQEFFIDCLISIFSMVFQH